MDTRHQSEYITNIAFKLINSDPELEHLKNADITVLYLESEHLKKSGNKAVLGVCEKIAEKYKWAIPCDFTVTIFSANCQGLTEKQMEILVKHELLHIGVDYDNMRYYIVPHDVEDFESILKEYGIDWAKHE